MAYRVHRNYAPDDIAMFQSLKGKGGLFEQGLFIAEGEKIARKALESSLEVPIAYCTQEHFKTLESLFDGRDGVTDVFLATKEDMEQVVGYALHQGLMLAARIPKSRRLDDAIASWTSPWMAVALDGIADAENMGGIIRNAAAFGARAAIVDRQSCNPWLRRSVRVSMGTIVDVEIIVVEDLAVALAEIRRTTPFRIIGAALSERSVDIASIKPEGNTMLVFGSEGWGLSNAVTETCETLVKIPIAPHVDSLNVAVASGIFMHWFFSRAEQRR